MEVLRDDCGPSVFAVPVTPTLTGDSCPWTQSLLGRVRPESQRSCQVEAQLCKVTLLEANFYH